MPVLDKEEYRRLKRELIGRISVLTDQFECRPLKSSKEGCSGRRHWIDPDSRCATVGSDSELRMAIDDFKNILSEIKRLK